VSSAKKCVIFDVDNTLANAGHRENWVRHSPKNWDAFFAAQRGDPPHHDVVELLKILHDAGWTVLISTGRGEEHRADTEWWLENVAGVLHLVDKVYMRPANDRRDDDVVKIEMLERMRADGYDPTLAFDDRDRVVKAWRSAGLRCLQVQEGDF
jgi:phosphoglycolate phosphatase-like HAD superfamily hydrolase